MDHSSYTSDSSEIITLLFISIIYAIDYLFIYVISIIKKHPNNIYCHQRTSIHTYRIYSISIVFELPSSAMYVLRRSVILEADFKLRIQNYYEKIIHTYISHFYVP